eukprot:gene13535-13661_t
MFTYALGGVELDVMLGSSNPEACIVLSLLYQFAMGTVLMSLLTGVMAQSMYKATAHEDLKRLLSKAQAIDELESTIPSFIEKLMPGNYPAFVHVLRIDPTLDDAGAAEDGNAMWHQQAEVSGEEGKPLGAGTQEADLTAAATFQALMQEISDLKGQVKELHDLLNTAVPSHFGSPGSEGLLLAEAE